MYSLVITSINDEDSAEEIITGLLELDIIRSATLIPQTRNYYYWKDELTIDEEMKIFFKLRDDKYNEFETFILNHHHYIAPEIVKIPASFGSERFLSEIRSRKQTKETEQ